MNLTGSRIMVCLQHGLTGHIHSQNIYLSSISESMVKKQENYITDFQNTTSPTSKTTGPTSKTTSPTSKTTGPTSKTTSPTSKTTGQEDSGCSLPCLIY